MIPGGPAFQHANARQARALVLHLPRGGRLYMPAPTVGSATSLATSRVVANQPGGVVVLDGVGVAVNAAHHGEVGAVDHGRVTSQSAQGRQRASSSGVPRRAGMCSKKVVAIGPVVGHRVVGPRPTVAHPIGVRGTRRLSIVP
jgi:hypothetical protein